jgi:hypothetical protein
VPLGEGSKDGRAKAATFAGAVTRGTPAGVGREPIVGMGGREYVALAGTIAAEEAAAQYLALF